MSAFTVITLSGLIAAIYHIVWYLRFRDSLEDTDFAYASYYGRKARKQRDRHVLSEARDFPTFKTILYYVFYWANGMSDSPVRGPRLLFAMVNPVGCLFFSSAICLLTGSVQKTLIGSFIYCVLSSAPQLGGLHLQSEFWALTFTSGSLALILTGHPVLMFMAGLLLAINPISVKPIYLLESLILFSLCPQGHIWLLLSGFLTSAALLFILYQKDGFFDWFFYHLKGWGIFNYTLKFSRNASKGRKVKNLTVFFPILLTLVPPLLLPPLAQASAVPEWLWFFLMACILIVFIQFRFYRYHFVVLLPASILLFVSVPFSVFHLFGMIPLFFSLSFFLPNDKEGLDHRINKRIRHYHTRNCVARPIAQWVRENTEPSDHILVVGSTIQIYVHSNRLSMYPQLFFSPEVTLSSPAQEKIMKEVLERTPPEIIIPDQNCLNWKTVEGLTGSRYRLVKSFEYDGECFPVYRKDGHFISKPSVDDPLFIHCLQKTKDRLIWNPLPEPNRLDPNPTATT